MTITVITPEQGARAMVAVPQQQAEEAGLRCRVLVDPGVWDDCVTWTGQDSARKGIALDEGARRADVLYPAACALQRDCARGTPTGLNDGQEQATAASAESPEQPDVRLPVNTRCSSPASGRTQEEG